jgi:hypothetical protein
VLLRVASTCGDWPPTRNRSRIRVRQRTFLRLDCKGLGIRTPITLSIIIHSIPPSTMSPTPLNPIVIIDLPADPELDRDDIRLLRSCNYTMDFSQIETTEVQLRRRLRRRSQTKATMNPPSPRERREPLSTSTSVDRPVRATRRPAINHARRWADRGDTTTTASTETRLAEYLQLSISFTANLTDHATTGDDDDSWHVFEDNASIHTIETPSLLPTGPRETTEPHRRRRRRPQADNDSSAASSSEGQKVRTKRQGVDFPTTVLVAPGQAFLPERNCLRWPKQPQLPSNAPSACATTTRIRTESPALFDADIPCVWPTKMILAVVLSAGFHSPGKPSRNPSSFARRRLLSMIWSVPLRRKGDRFVHGH